MGLKYLCEPKWDQAEHGAECTVAALTTKGADFESVE